MTKFLLTKTQVALLCTQGSMAPSGGNAQPWQVKVKDNTFKIGLNPSRAGNLLDVDCMGSIFSLGCFVENIVITAHQLGLKEDLSITKGKKGIEFEVEMTFSKNNGVLSNKDLYSFIEKRLTNRKFYNGKIIDEEHLKKLYEIGKSFNFNLYYHSDLHKKREISNVLGKADAFRATKEELRDFMFKEIRWNDKEVNKTRDGLDIKTLEMPPNVVKIFNLMKRYPSMISLLPSKVLEDQAKPVLVGSSHLCCLAIDAPLNYEKVFEAGRCIERIWLEATKRKLAIQPWTVLPFFVIRAQYYSGNEFSTSEGTLIKRLGRELIESFGIEENKLPLFIFRLSESSPASARSLRLTWDKFTTLE